jgi:HipA-like protein
MMPKIIENLKNNIAKIQSKLFSKDQENDELHSSKNEMASFVLSVDNVEVGVLKCNLGVWTFKYSAHFKQNKDEYRKIIGFPNLDKIYQSESLWPFFRVRIPGLKQPAIREIIEKEHINKENQVELLKRFGYKTITNPYILSYQPMSLSMSQKSN